MRREREKGKKREKEKTQQVCPLCRKSSLCRNKRRPEVKRCKCGRDRNESGQIGIRNRTDY